MAQASLEIIKNFVAGEISAAEFKKYLYSSVDIENFLSNDPALGANNYVWPSVYQFLLREDLDRVGGAYNCQGALADFMDRNGYKYDRTDVYEKRFNLILNSQPKWLDVPDDWIEKNILSRAEGRAGKVLKEWVKAEILQAFKYVTKPPSWLQSPSWPIRDGRPLVFLGQIKVDNYFHDTASIYIFHDPSTNKTENVVQTA